MTPNQGKELRKNLREKFDLKANPRRIITNYFIPKGYNTRNLQTYFKNVRDPDEFLKEMTKLAKIAKRLGAEIIMKKTVRHYSWDRKKRYLSIPVIGGMCLRTSREETDQEYNERTDSERKYFVEKEIDKIKRKDREFTKGNILAKLTLAERKLLGIKA